MNAERITQINHGDNATQIAVLNIHPPSLAKTPREPKGVDAALATLLAVWLSLVSPWAYIMDEGSRQLVGPVSYTALFFLSYVSVMILLFTLIVGPYLLHVRTRS